MIDKLKRAQRTAQQIQDQTRNVASGSEITLCHKIDKPLVVYRYDVQNNFAYITVYLHFRCEILNEPLHLRCGSYLHEQIHQRTLLSNHELRLNKKYIWKALKFNTAKIVANDTPPA